MVLHVSKSFSLITARWREFMQYFHFLQGTLSAETRTMNIKTEILRLCHNKYRAIMKLIQLRLKFQNSKNSK